MQMAANFEELLRELFRSELRTLLREELRAATTLEARGLSIQDAACRLGIGETLLRQLIDEGSVRAISIGRRRVVPEAEIARVLRDGAELRQEESNVVALPAVQGANDARRDAARQPRGRRS